MSFFGKHPSIRWTKKFHILFAADISASLREDFVSFFSSPVGCGSIQKALRCIRRPGCPKGLSRRGFRVPLFAAVPDGSSVDPIGCCAICLVHRHQRSVLRSGDPRIQALLDRVVRLKLRVRRPCFEPLLGCARDRYSKPAMKRERLNLLSKAIKK